MDNILFDQNNEPYSLEAEQAVLGSLLMDPDCLLSIADITKPEHFYIPQHREIFSIIINLDAIGQKFDALLVLEELKSKGIYDDAGGKNYLAQLAQIVPSTANVVAYAKIVKEKYVLRTLLNTLYIKHSRQRLARQTYRQTLVSTRQCPHGQHRHTNHKQTEKSFHRHYIIGLHSPE